MTKQMTTSEQARLDAMADAETLRIVYSDTVGLAYVGCLDDIRTAETLAFRALGSTWNVAGFARDSARSIFRAVPALRGEEE